MKINGIVTFAAVLTLIAGTARAQTSTTTTTTTTGTPRVWESPNEWWGGHFVYTPAATAKYTACEFSLDAFASYITPEREFSHMFQNNIRDGTWGGGVGVNYFFLRELGIGGDINIPNNGGHFVDSMNGSLIARLPIEAAGLAPYIFGGGGRTTDPVWEWTGHAGLGLEFRMNPLTGIFFDTRYIWADKASDNLQFRAGLRLVF